MEVATLVARLEADVGRFLAAMDTADKAMATAEKSVVSLETSMKELGFDPSKVAAIVSEMKTIQDSVGDTTVTTQLLAAALDDLGIPAGQTAKNITEIKAVTAALKDERTAALEAAAAMKLTPSGIFGGIPGVAAPFRGAPLEPARALQQYRDELGQLVSFEQAIKNLPRLTPAGTVGFGGVQQFRNAEGRIVSQTEVQNIAAMKKLADQIAADTILKAPYRQRLGMGDTLAASRMLVERYGLTGLEFGPIGAQQLVQAILSKERQSTGGGLGVLLAPILGKRAGQTVAAVVGDSKGGGKGGRDFLGGLLTGIGWGGGRGIPIPFLGRGFGFGRGFAGMAAFGSLAGLAGFGAEHVLTSGIGIGGSLLGGLAGGGLLAAGALGTAAVGAGTNLAGIGQAAGDIRTVTGDITNLKNAISTYGSASTQAADAQAQLNTDLNSFSQVARPAVLAAANTAQGFHALFNQLTGPAEKIGAEIINQAMKTGEKFLPTIGTYAAQNMGILQKDLQPLFQWLYSPASGFGLGVFGQLEKIFQGNFPTAISAFTQGIELFIKTIGVAATQTGSFMTRINDFLTRVNSPTGFSTWSQEILKLIDLFKTWVGMFGSVGRVIYELFLPSVGFGKNFAMQLTSIFNQIDGWLKQPSTQQILGGLFTAHFNEVINGIAGIFKALLPILEETTTAFVKMSTAITDVVNLAFKPLIDGIKWLASHDLSREIIGWSLAFVLVRNALAGVITLLGFGLPAAAVKGAAGADVALGSTGLVRIVIAAKTAITNLQLALLGLGSSAVLTAIAAATGALAGFIVYEGLTNPNNADIQYANGRFYQLQNTKYGASQEFLTPAQAAKMAQNGIVSASAAAALKAAGFTIHPSAIPNSAAAVSASTASTAANFVGVGRGVHYGNLLQPPVALLRAYTHEGAFGLSQSKTGMQIFDYYKSIYAQAVASGAPQSVLNSIQAAMAPYAPLNVPGAGPAGPALTPAGTLSAAARAAALSRIQTSTNAGGNVLSAQQNAQQLMATGSGASFYQQVQAAKAFGKASQDAYNALVAMKVPAQLANDKAAELLKLKTDEAQAQRDILAIMQKQYAANVANISAGMTIAKQNYNTALAGAQNGAQELAAAKILLDTYQKQADLLEKQIKLKHDAIPAARELRRVTADIAVAHQDITQAHKSLRIDQILGITGAGSSTGVEQAARSSTSLRAFLNTTLKQFGLAQTGSNPLGPYIQRLSEAGDITKKQYTALMKIYDSIELMRKDSGKLVDATAIQQNINERLAEIKQELAPSSGFSLSNAKRGMRIAGMSAIQAEEAAAALQGNGKIQYAGAIGGAPLLPNGALALQGRVHFIQTVTINVSGTGNPDEVAARVQDKLVRTAFRNSNQVRGPFAGLQKPFQW